MKSLTQNTSCARRRYNRMTETAARCIDLHADLLMLTA